MSCPASMALWMKFSVWVMQSPSACAPSELRETTLLGMALPHEWYECHPAVLKLDGPMDPEDARLMNAAVAAAWAQLTDRDRQAFHRFCCFNARDLECLPARSNGFATRSVPVSR